MASKVKSIKKNSKAAESLKQDKEETLEVKKLLKDERTHKITGSVLILVALLFLLRLPLIYLPGMKTRIKYLMKGINSCWAAKAKSII